MWRDEPLNIFNLYHPPNIGNLPGVFDNLLSGNTLLLGDLNAKHPAWGCSTQNQRGFDLLHSIDDSGFMIFNDGTPTHSSYSYNTSEALDLSIVSPTIFPICIWTVMKNIGSDHSPILIEIKKKQCTLLNRKKYWNFAKADWKAFGGLVDTLAESGILSSDLDTNWITFKHMLFKATKRTIPRGKVKLFNPYFTHNLPILLPLLQKRENLRLELKYSNTEQNRTEMNKVNAEIKRTYMLLRRKKWMDTCEGLDARSSDTKLWKLIKNISSEQPQIKRCNTILDSDGNIPIDEKAAADLLGEHYQKTSEWTYRPRLVNS
ncbi:RNA-directed DNA polymerase from mobile element jockey, partial [Stegodyphus mimosarum]